MQDSIFATIIVNKSVLDSTKELICDTTKVQTALDNAIPLETWNMAQQFYSTTVDKNLTIVTIFAAIITIFITIIAILVAIAGIYNSRSRKNLKEELKKDLEEEKKNLKSKVIYELKSEIKKIKAISYFTDHDMQTYRTVKIGSQVWMAENYNYPATGSLCYDNNLANGKKYGRLYDWNTAKEICPAGWHLPSNDEWQILINFAGGDSIAGKKLKSDSDWNDNGNGEDEYFFAALPGGLRNSEGNFVRVDYKGVWWSDTEINASEAYSRGIDSGGINSKGIYFDGDYVFKGNDEKSNLLSVRYLKD